MISDPINITREMLYQDKNLFINRFGYDKKVFGILECRDKSNSYETDTLCLCSLDYNHYGKIIFHWAIEKYYCPNEIYILIDGKSNIKINGDIATIDIEIFMEYMKVNYPDHFEWLLFHPEWMQ